MEQSKTTRKKTEEGTERSILSIEEWQNVLRCSLERKERELKRGQRQLELDRKRLQRESESERAQACERESAVCHEVESSGRGSKETCG